MNAHDAYLKAATGALPGAREICPPTEHEVPVALQKALEAAQDNLLTLEEEASGMEGKIGKAKQRVNKAEVTKLNVRQAELPEALYHARVAVLKAEQGILDAQCPAGRDASIAAAEALKIAGDAICEAVYAARIAEQCSHILWFRSKGNRDRRLELEQQIEALNEQYMATA